MEQIETNLERKCFKLMSRLHNIENHSEAYLKLENSFALKVHPKVKLRTQHAPNKSCAQFIPERVINFFNK